MKNRRFLFGVAIFNTVLALGTSVFLFVNLVGWQIGFFYGNKDHVEPARLDRIRTNAENLYATSLVAFGITNIAWFVLACFLLGGSKQVPPEPSAELHSSVP